MPWAEYLQIGSAKSMVQTLVKVHFLTPLHHSMVKGIMWVCIEEQEVHAEQEAWTIRAASLILSWQPKGTGSNRTTLTPLNSSVFNDLLTLHWTSHLTSFTTSLICLPISPLWFECQMSFLRLMYLDTCPPTGSDIWEKYGTLRGWHISEGRLWGFIAGAYSVSLLPNGDQNVTRQPPVPTSMLSFPVALSFLPWCVCLSYFSSAVKTLHYRENL